jgi:hypothetical protein
MGSSLNWANDEHSYSAGAIISIVIGRKGGVALGNHIDSLRIQERR